MTWSEFIECASQWSSILGFFLGIVTVILAGTIKRAVSRTKKKAVFRARGEENINKLKAANSEFVQIVDCKDREVVRKSLSSLKTAMNIALRSIPEEFRRKGEKTVKQIFTQYWSIFYWEPDKWYDCIFVHTSRAELFDTYNQVTDFIDSVSNYIEENRIID